MPNSLTGNIARIADAKLDLIEILLNFGILSNDDITTVRIDDIAEIFNQIPIYKETSLYIGD